MMDLSDEKQFSPSPKKPLYFPLSNFLFKPNSFPNSSESTI